MMILETSRRGLFTMSALAVAGFGLGASRAGAAILHATGAGWAGQVVAFHQDDLYLDTSGSTEPYLAPAGARGAAHLADLEDHQIALAVYHL